MHEPIAIVGMGCRFPQADDVQAFWRLLHNNIDAITDVPADRWDAAALFHADRNIPGRTYARRGGFLREVDRFDARFFGISPREAASMDPQTRLMLEVACEAFDDAAFDRDRYAERTGVYVGISGSDYQDMLLSDRESIDGYMATGTALCIAANRISHAFDLHGPSLACDTACSSSLVAVHLACASLWSGECDAAIAGGVCLLLRPEVTIGFSKGFMLSPDARCMAFDARGNGFVRGEGAGAILLKRLADAVRDRDSIYALVAATNVNQDGHTPTGIAVPNIDAQRRSLVDAYAKAGVEPSQVHYVEAHGPGTPVGDPIEAEALGSVLGGDRAHGDELVVGSVKTNIGHLEPAAGIAGLIKTALALSHEMIPANLHFEAPNPKIAMASLGIRVPRHNEPWNASDGRRRIAGVNSFGFGGTNAHVVLAGVESAAVALPRSATPSDAPHTVRVLALSAHTEDALRESACRMADWLEADEPNLDDVCYTSVARRGRHDCRLALPAFDRAQAIDELRAWIRGEARSGTSTTTGPATSPRIGFVFCGMGSHWWGMGRQLLADEPTFREVIERCDAIMQPWVDWSLLDELLRPEPESRLARFDIAQPAMFALQCGLAAMWRSYGIVPHAIVGHSVGEAAAACAAGALTLYDAARVVVARSRLQVTTQGKGALLAVGLAEEAVQRYLAGREDRVSVAAVNGPGTVTLAGDLETIAAIAGEIEPTGVFCRRLRADVPAHSPAMDPLRPALVDSVRGIACAPTTTPLYSTVTGALIDGARLDAEYWGDNLRRPVRFEAAARSMMAAGIDVIVEISPHPVLSQALAECAAADHRRVAVVASLRRAEPELRHVAATLAALQVRGASPVGHGKIISLPTYPWQRERHWKEPDISASARLPRRGPPLLGVACATPQPTWEVGIHTASFPYVYDHRVQGDVIWPAAGYVEMAVEAVRDRYPEAAVVLRDVRLERAMVTPTDAVITARLELGTDSFTVHSRRANASDWVFNAGGRFELGTRGTPARLDLGAIRARCAELATEESFYAKLERMGDDFGPAFKTVRELRMGDRECLARIEMPDGIAGEQGIHVHPVLLDGCFQAVVANLPRAAEGSALPVLLRELRVISSVVAGPIFAHTRLVRADKHGFAGDATVVDGDGNVLVELRGFEFRSLEATEQRPTTSLLHVARWRLDEAWPEDGEAVWSSPSSQSAALARIGARSGLEHGRQRHYERARPSIDMLAVTYVAEAFAHLGMAFDPGTSTSRAGLAERLRIAPRHVPLFERLLSHLEAAGIIECRGDDWHPRRPHGLCSRDQAVALAAALPDYNAELSLLRRCGTRLAEVLIGELDPLSVVFPDGATSELEHLYATSPTAHVYNRILVASLSHLLAKDRTRGLRILEVGAGTCGTTVHLVEALRPVIAEYICTDISPVFARRAGARLAAYPFVTHRDLDLEHDPVAQGFAPASFDLVVAADAVHTTRDVTATVRRLRAMLRPGGMLALVELTRAPLWPDVTFGLLPGWWSFEDRDVRPASALVNASRWKHILRDAGLDVASVSDFADAAEQTVLLGVAPHVPRSEPAPSTTSGSWIVVGERGSLATEVAAELRTLGADACAVEPGAAFNAESARGIVLCSAIAGDGDEAVAARTAAESCAALVKTVNDAGSRARLFIVTCDAQAVHDGDGRDVASATLWGLGRVIANEHPEWRPSLVDVAGVGPRAGAVVARELARGGNDDEVALRADGRYVRRWLRVGADAVAPAGVPERNQAGVAPGHIGISVDAVGLPDAARVVPVWEVAGRVTALGDGVDDLAIGADVIAFASAAPERCVVVPRSRVVSRPQVVEPTRAVAGTAALTGLETLLRVHAQLAPGAVLWIHGASTHPLVLPAVCVARSLGLNPIVSAFDPAHARDLLRCAVVDARSIRLGDELRAAATRDIDAALLLETPPPGEHLATCLRTGAQVWISPGAFDGVSITGAVVARGVMLAPLDVEALVNAGCESKSVRHVVHQIATGRLDVLPHRVFAGADVAAAPRDGTDKVVLDFRGLTPASAVPTLRGDATYLVTGGFGGLGLRLASHLADRGARRLVLASRSGATSDAARCATVELQARGVEVVAITADVSTREGMERVLAAAREPGKPLRGIVHAAMVLEDAVVTKLTRERLAHVLAPKLDAALHLDALTVADPLDFFVLFSSFAAIVGNPGQGAYAAANATLDALAARRRAEGRSGVSINWGSIAGAGYVADRAEIDAHLRQRGIVPMTASRAMNAFDLALSSTTAQVAVIDVDWSRWCAVHPTGSAPRFAQLRAEDQVADVAEVSVSADATRSTLDSIRLETARSLRMPAADLPLDVPLLELGFDSLMAVELRTWLHNALGIDVPTMKIMRGPTVRQLAELVDEARRPRTVETPVLAEPSREGGCLSCRVPRPQAAARLFCIPYNGGSIASYHAWTDLIPPSIEVHSIALAGQMDRRDESIPAHLADWAASVADAIAPLLDRPYAIYGHSLGGLVGFELARELRRRGLAEPTHLFVSAIHAPHLPDPFPSSDRLTDFETLRRLGMLEALAPLLADKQLVDELRPTIQRGIALLKSYCMTFEPPLHSTIIAMRGTNDDVVVDAHVDGWRQHASDGFEKLVFGGGHLFHEDDPESVVAAVARRIEGTETMKEVA